MHVSPVIKNTRFGIVCNQEWENMRDHPKGKYCDACQKPVIDFTQYSREQIAVYLKLFPKSCGTYYMADVDPSFIRTDHLVQKVRRPFILLGLLSFLGFKSPVYGQSRVPEASAPAADTDYVKPVVKILEDDTALEINTPEPVKAAHKNRRSKRYLSKRFPYIRSNKRLGGCRISNK